MVKKPFAVLFAFALLIETAGPAVRVAAAQQANPDFGRSSSGGAPTGGSVQSAGASRGIQIGATQTEASLYKGTEEVSPLDTKVTVRVKRAPLAAFLDTISAQAKVNFIMAKGLEKVTVTAFLRNVTVREALQILQTTKGLIYQRVGKSNTYIISARGRKTVQRVTKIYTLNYIPLVALSDSNAGSAGTGESGGSEGGGSGGGSSGGSSGGGSSGGGSAGGIPIINVISTVLSKEGKVAIEPRTNSLIVTDYPEVFPQVEQILAELDKKSPQVLIEAQIVEIDTDKVNELGIEWGGPKGEMAFFAAGARLTDWPISPRITEPGQWKRVFDSSIVPGTGLSVGSGSETSEESSGSTESSINLNPITGTGIINNNDPTTFLGVLSFAQLQALFRALIQRSEARFLGKPKILCLNNKTSVIEITQRQAVGIATVISGGEGTSSSTSSAERFDTGLKLSVTPQVNREGFITLLVEPKYSDVVAARVSTPSQPVFDPIDRGLKSLVRVKNGQTIVMGGLLSSRETKIVRKVPLLGYIPIIGWFFTSVSNDRKNTDLVIFITPTIIND